MDSPRKSKGVTPKTRKRKLDSLEQKGSMMKYCSSSSSQSSPVITAVKSYSQPSKPRKVISADSDEEDLIEDYCEALPKDKKKRSCTDKNSWKPNSSEQAKLKSSPIKVLSRNNSKQDSGSDYSPSPSLKAKKRVVACPDSPKLEDMDMQIPAKKMKSDDSVMESKSSKSKDKTLGFSLSKPKLRLRENVPKNVTPSKKRDVITCPESPLANSDSGSSFGSTKSQKEKLELELFGPMSPTIKSRTVERESRSKDGNKKPKTIECPELPKISSRYHEMTSKSKHKESFPDSQSQRTPSKSLSSSSSCSKVLVIPDSPVIVEDRSKKLKTKEIESSKTSTS